MLSEAEDAGILTYSEDGNKVMRNLTEQMLICFMRISIRACLKIDCITVFLCVRSDCFLKDVCFLKSILSVTEAENLRCVTDFHSGFYFWNQYY